MRITPPRIPALPASLVPARLPIKIPKRQMAKVTAPIIRQAIRASKKLCSAIVKPTDKASIEVATPCTKRAAKGVRQGLDSQQQSFSSCKPSHSILPPMNAKRPSAT